MPSLTPASKPDSDPLDRKWLIASTVAARAFITLSLTSRLRVPAAVPTSRTGADTGEDPPPAAEHSAGTPAQRGAPQVDVHADTNQGLMVGCGLLRPGILSRGDNMGSADAWGQHQSPVGHSLWGPGEAWPGSAARQASSLSAAGRSTDLIKPSRRHPVCGQDAAQHPQPDQSLSQVSQLSVAGPAVSRADPTWSARITATTRACRDGVVPGVGWSMNRPQKRPFPMARSSISPPGQPF
ncbi:hypothetical protein GCM10010376_62830 [Streptomyces violaceusniger]